MRGSRCQGSKSPPEKSARGRRALGGATARTSISGQLFWRVARPCSRDASATYEARQMLADPGATEKVEADAC